ATVGLLFRGGGRAPVSAAVLHVPAPQAGGPADLSSAASNDSGTSPDGPLEAVFPVADASLLLPGHPGSCGRWCDAVPAPPRRPGALVCCQRPGCRSGGPVASRRCLVPGHPVLGKPCRPRPDCG